MVIAVMLVKPDEMSFEDFLNEQEAEIVNCAPRNGTVICFTEMREEDCKRVIDIAAHAGIDTVVWTDFEVTGGGRRYFGWMGNDEEDVMAAVDVYAWQLNQRETWRVESTGTRH